MSKAKEFERDFWTKNNPMTTPIWKCLEAYADQEVKPVQQELERWKYLYQTEFNKNN